ncbi:hypothetical protein COV89_03140 [Candidatus Shapirobacteria bacterium CG11_big_fil_rev_8_21_14_0_20_40_12]|uniref:DUF4349 domain-containing protein n=2 Tax=Candidatus Shapironibacteriota TaxID=1752721 RepID=A0A2M8EVN1_9BACT|nr:MAG: hypothetical protein COV89_03140 [Candidatus Shapirobacteria bacterium CG11_big_fil_rev_8_21_14_0_20_40_12]PJC29158.1 MAG: hypothetical protein CO053_00800 [Candidatus Shapirobacteria bacterium CG_4_9_14_0_2_um_filter_40_11]
MISWIKRNKLATVLLLVVAFFLFKQYSGGIRPLYQSVPSYGGVSEDSFALKSSSGINNLFLPAREAAPTTGTDRLVVQESNLSLVVKDVRNSSDKAIEYAKSAGGYMVSSSLSQPEEAPYAFVVLRVPSEKLKETTEYFRSLSIKVSSENLVGTDVTDQYIDLEARLAILNKTKVKFEEIMNQAVKVPDMLEVQRELINVQSQIDSIKGQQLYLEKTAELAKISLNLSTDEFSLPYAPTDTFRPAVIFKQAVRSMVGTARSLAKLAIWIGVYGIIIVPVGLVIWYFRKRRKTVKISS